MRGGKELARLKIPNWSAPVETNRGSLNGQRSGFLPPLEGSSHLQCENEITGMRDRCLDGRDTHTRRTTDEIRVLTMAKRKPEGQEEQLSPGPQISR